MSKICAIISMMLFAVVVSADELVVGKNYVVVIAGFQAECINSSSDQPADLFIGEYETLKFVKTTRVNGKKYAIIKRVDQSEKAFKDKEYRVEYNYLNDIVILESDRYKPHSQVADTISNKIFPRKSMFTLTADYIQGVSWQDEQVRIIKGAKLILGQMDYDGKVASYDFNVLGERGYGDVEFGKDIIHCVINNIEEVAKLENDKSFFGKKKIVQGEKYKVLGSIYILYVDTSPDNRRYFRGKRLRGDWDVIFSGVKKYSTEFDSNIEILGMLSEGKVYYEVEIPELKIGVDNNNGSWKYYISQEQLSVLI